MVSFTPLPLCPRGKSPCYPLDRRLGGPQSQSKWSGAKKKIFPLPRIESRPQISHKEFLFSLISVMREIQCSWGEAFNKSDTFCINSDCILKWKYETYKAGLQHMKPIPFTIWHILKLQMEKKASRCGGELSIYWINIRLRVTLQHWGYAWG
jgi:hypothetical protein